MIILSFHCFLRYNKDIGGHYNAQKFIFAGYSSSEPSNLAFLIQSLFSLIIEARKLTA